MSLIQQSELTGLLDIVLKENGLLRKGNNLQYHCPFCNHRKRKLEICLDSPYVWNCWVCHQKGKGVRWLFKKMNVDNSVYKKLEQIGLKENTVSQEAKEVDEKPALTLPVEFRSLLDRDDSREWRDAMRYVKKRKITPYDIVKHGIGYCSEGRYRNRLIFPSYDLNNKLNFFTGRSYYDDVYLKYDNCDSHKNIIGFENMVDFRYPISLTEGALDAIAVRRNVIPLFGTYPSPMLKLALIINKPEVNVILDPDAVTHAITISKFLIQIGLKVKLIDCGNSDPNKLGFENISKIIKETDYLDFGSLTKLRLEALNNLI